METIANIGARVQASRPIVEAYDLVKDYKIGECRVRALCGVSLAIDPGAFVAVTGPSGSGKSTLMNVLGLLDAPTFGLFRFKGVDISRLKQNELACCRNADIGFVFQNFNLLPKLSAEENVALPLVYAGASRKQQNERARALLNSVGLDDRRNHRPCQLSGGQQQRVAIARALANDPSLILADEPTGALDSRSSGKIMEILQMLAERGVTVLVITHEPHVARYVKRNIALKDGSIVSDSANMAAVA